MISRKIAWFLSNRASFHEAWQLARFVLSFAASGQALPGI